MNDTRYAPNRQCSSCHNDLPDHEAYRVPIAETDHVLCIRCYKKWITMQPPFRNKLLPS